MPVSKQLARDAPAELAKSLPEVLQRERIVPHFVDSYVVEHSRYALQSHPARYRELLALIALEALLAMTVRALEEVTNISSEGRKSRARHDILRPQAFRRNFLAALARQQKWSAGDALDFQAELSRYEDLLARRPGAKRARKAFEAADHPFVDRCAILLDPSFIEQARIAASRALSELESLAAKLTMAVFDKDSR